MVKTCIACIYNFLSKNFYSLSVIQYAIFVNTKNKYVLGQNKENTETRLWQVSVKV